MDRGKVPVKRQMAVLEKYKNYVQSKYKSCLSTGKKELSID